MAHNNKLAKNKHWDILGIGSPLFDIVIPVSEEMLVKLNFKKGSMTLISKEESENIFRQFKNEELELTPGGSVSNTLSGANLLGNRVSFLGLVGQDEHGKKYQEKIEAEGVASHLCFHDGGITGHVIVFVTPDGERTMATHLGASINFNKNHIQEKEIRRAKIIHIEAYQLEGLASRQAILHAVEIAKKNSVLVSLDLSDTQLIRRNKKLFANIVKKHVDIVFANEEEASEFSGKKNPRKALDEIAKNCRVAVVKLGEKGSLIEEGEKVFEISPHQVEVENTNGAGDMYAAGILHGLINNLDLKEAGKIASHVSALVVASSGSRLDKKYHHLIHPVK